MFFFPTVRQILAIEMHRGLRPLGASALPPSLQAGALPGSSSSSGSGDEAGKDSSAKSSGDDSADAGGGAEGVEGSRAAAKAVEGFIRKNIEAYFGCWTSTYTLFSLDPRLVRHGSLWRLGWIFQAAVTELGLRSVIFFLFFCVGRFFFVRGGLDRRSLFLFSALRLGTVSIRLWLPCNLA